MTATNDWFLLDEEGDEVLIMMPGGRMVRGKIVPLPPPPADELAFDPAAWLARFIAAGGWYVLRSDTLVFGWPVPTDEQAIATREIYREVEGQHDRVDAIKALVRERCLMA